MSRRPRSFTFAALLLGWLGCGGVTLAIWAATAPSRLSAQLPYGIVGGLYAISAFGSAIAIWIRRPWGIGLVWSWIVLTLIASWMPQLIERNQPPLWLGLAGIVLVGVVVAPLGLWIIRYLRTPA